MDFQEEINLMLTVSGLFTGEHDNFMTKTLLFFSYI